MVDGDFYVPIPWIAGLLCHIHEIFTHFDDPLAFHKEIEIQDIILPGG